MLTFTQEVPEWAVVCDHIKGKAEGYIEIQHFGIPYFVPVTKEMKRIFGISRREGKLVFKSARAEMDAERFLPALPASRSR